MDEGGGDFDVGVGDKFYEGVGSALTGGALVPGFGVVAEQALHVVFQSGDERVPGQRVEGEVPGDGPVGTFGPVALTLGLLFIGNLAVRVGSIVPVRQHRRELSPRATLRRFDQIVLGGLQMASGTTILPAPDCVHMISGDQALLESGGEHGVVEQPIPENGIAAGTTRAAGFGPGSCGHDPANRAVTRLPAVERGAGADGGQAGTGQGVESGADGMQLAHPLDGFAPGETRNRERRRGINGMVQLLQDLAWSLHGHGRPSHISVSKRLGSQGTGVQENRSYMIRAARWGSKTHCIEQLFGRQLQRRETNCRETTRA